MDIAAILKKHWCFQCLCDRKKIHKDFLVARAASSDTLLSAVTRQVRALGRFEYQFHNNMKNFKARRCASINSCEENE